MERLLTSRGHKRGVYPGFKPKLFLEKSRIAIGFRKKIPGINEHYRYPGGVIPEEL